LFDRTNSTKSASNKVGILLDRKKKSKKNPQMFSERAWPRRGSQKIDLPAWKKKGSKKLILSATKERIPARIHGLKGIRAGFDGKKQETTSPWVPEGKKTKLNKCF